MSQILWDRQDAYPTLLWEDAYPTLLWQDAYPTLLCKGRKI